jgi:hypothetical protein
MKKFTYKGKQDHNSTILVEKAGEKDGEILRVQQDLRLTTGDEFDLDEEHSVIKALINQGLLVESEAGKQVSQIKNPK